MSGGRRFWVDLGRADTVALLWHGAGVGASAACVLGQCLWGEIKAPGSHLPWIFIPCLLDFCSD